MIAFKGFIFPPNIHFKFTVPINVPDRKLCMKSVYDYVSNQ